MAGITGLDADTAVIAPKQLVVIGKRPARTDRSFGRDDRAELCVLQRCLRKVGQIERSGIIFAAVQPVRVGKVRLRQAQRTGAQIHLADKRCFAAGNGDCQRQGSIIAGMEHHAVEQIAARQRLILFRYILDPSSPTAASGTVTVLSSSPASQTRRPVMIFVVLAISARCSPFSRKGTPLSSRRAVRRFWPTPAEAVRAVRRWIYPPRRGKRRRRRVPPPLAGSFFDRCVSFCITLPGVCAEYAGFMLLPLPFRPLLRLSFPRNMPRPFPADRAAAQSGGRPTWRLAPRPGAYARSRRGSQEMRPA